ncbi:uncharacterized protein LOC113771616 [Coffea eugenioides]|uniref:uncharacterized protein LOC113771616 n=1 Tax=Coffea eugenioides TaxID=49369 RepID=UPI000F60E240|nr:uncharacterized protein LOC113771616 [Coffea eugenioides]
MNKRITVAEFKDKVHAELNVNITKSQVYKTFMKAKILIHGSYKDQYNRLWDYCDELMKANPGSTALKRGFKSGCRKIIGVDGCHLRGPHPGVLLTGVGINSNDYVYPVAYAVVEAEKKRSWKWFIEFLKYNLSINDQRNWRFISDKQKGLGSAIQKVIPDVEHRQCIECLRDYDVAAWKWLNDNSSPYHWPRSYFRVAAKCGILLNNLCESFNSVIMDAREKPILGMLETIRIYLMERFRTKREWIKKMSDKICPKIQKKLEKAKTEVAANIARWSEQDKFEVTHMYRGQELESLVHHYYSRDSYLKAYEPAIVSLSGQNVWVQSDKDPILSSLKLKLPGRPKKVRREEPRPNSKGATKLSKSGLIRMTYKKCNQKGNIVRKCPLLVPPNEFGASSNKRPPPSNSNKCSKCKALGHNKRTCPQNLVTRENATCELPPKPGDKAQAAIDEQEVIDL